VNDEVWLVMADTPDEHLGGLITTVVAAYSQLQRAQQVVRSGDRTPREHLYLKKVKVL